MPLTVAAAQYPISPFETFADWQAHTARWVGEAANAGAEVLLFPEYGAMELTSLLAPARQADLHGQIAAMQAFLPAFIDTFRELSARHNLLIATPSIPVPASGRVLNRVYVADQGRILGAQDKYFMTRFEDEQWGISGRKAPPVLLETRWGPMGIQICYDVEFPFGAQALCARGARLILAPSCTETVHGASRVHIGARARALENQCYVLVSQTVGEAPWSPAVDLNFGYAACYAPPDTGLPDDGVVARMAPQTPGWLVQTLDFGLVDQVRRDGAVFNWKDMGRASFFPE